jgi:hypothetical protein
MEPCPRGSKSFFSVKIVVSSYGSPDFGNTAMLPRVSPKPQAMVSPIPEPSRVGFLVLERLRVLLFSEASAADIVPEGVFEGRTRSG